MHREGSAHSVPTPAHAIVADPKAVDGSNPSCPLVSRRHVVCCILYVTCACEGRNPVHCVYLACHMLRVVHCAAPLSSEWLHMRAEGRASLCRHKLTAPDCACRSDGTARNTNFPQWLFMDVLRSPPVTSCTVQRAETACNTRRISGQ